ncbi:MAG: AAA family ATPase [Bacteroidales bacterium]|nr:AAA family ATPase [Bacteroidales bacterium]
MKIKELHIESFRGISKMDFDSFDDNVNLFLGENGAGKSSILDAINILLSWLTAKALNVKGKGRSINGEDVKMGSASCEIAIELDDKTSWKLTKSTKESKSDLSALNEFVAKYFTEDGSRLPVIVYYDVNRYVSDIQTENGISFKDFFAWFRNQEDIENEQRIENSQYRDYKLEAVRNAMLQIFPGYSGLKVRRNPLSLLINKGTETLNLNQLSDGEKCYITLVCDLARRLADANPDGNPLEGNGIVLIDEVDLHLHPKWQLEVVSKLKNTFRNCQFFYDITFAACSI